jgi:hypothetical protein
MMNEKQSLNIQQVIDELVKIRDKQGPNIKVVYIHPHFLCDYPELAVDSMYYVSLINHPITNGVVVSFYCSSD